MAKPRGEGGNDLSPRAQYAIYMGFPVVTRRRGVGAFMEDSMAIDNKTKAEVLREFEPYLNEQGHYKAAECLGEVASRLDPQEPEISDGFVWMQTIGGHWRPGLKSAPYLIEENGIKYRYREEELGEVKPARVLEPGQVAVDRQAIVEAIAFLRFEEHIFSAERLQTALDRDTEARR